MGAEVFNFRLNKNAIKNRITQCVQLPGVEICNRRFFLILR